MAGRLLAMGERDTPHLAYCSFPTDLSDGDIYGSVLMYGLDAALLTASVL